MTTTPASATSALSSLLEAALASIVPIAESQLSDASIKELTLLVGAPMLLNALDLLDHKEGQLLCLAYPCWVGGRCEIGLC